MNNSNQNYQEVRFANAGTFFDGAKTHELTGFNIYHSEESDNIVLVPVNEKKIELNFQFRVKKVDTRDLGNAFYFLFNNKK